MKNANKMVLDGEVVSFSNTLPIVDVKEDVVETPIVEEPKEEVEETVVDTNDEEVVETEDEKITESAETTEEIADEE